MKQKSLSKRKQAQHLHKLFVKDKCAVVGCNREVLRRDGQVFVLCNHHLQQFVEGTLKPKRQEEARR